MFSSLLLAASLAQTSFIPLAGPGELDGGGYASLAGNRVVLDHVDRLVVRDLTSGAPVLEIDEPLPTPDLLTVSTDGQVAYLVRRYRPQRVLIAGFRLDTGAALPELNLTYPWTFLGSTSFELVLNDDGSRVMAAFRYPRRRQKAPSPAARGDR